MGSVEQCEADFGPLVSRPERRGALDGTGHVVPCQARHPAHRQVIGGDGLPGCLGVVVAQPGVEHGVDVAAADGALQFSLPVYQVVAADPAPSSTRAPPPARRSSPAAASRLCRGPRRRGSCGRAALGLCPSGRGPCQASAQPQQLGGADAGGRAGQRHGQGQVAHFVGEPQGPNNRQRQGHQRQEPTLDGVPQGRGHGRQQDDGPGERHRVSQQVAGVKQPLPKISSLVHVADQIGRHARGLRDGGWQ